MANTDKGDVDISCGSVSTNGLQIPITGTASGAGTTVHTAVAGTDEWDQVTLEGTNVDAASQPFCVEVGGSGAGFQRWFSLRPKSTEVLTSFRVNNGTVVKVFCAGGANLINVAVEVDRYKNT
jgi:hypothetical protein